MSIINKILNEIEKNKEKNTLGKDKPITLELGSAFYNYKAKLFNVFVVGIILVIILVFALLLIHKNKSNLSAQNSISIPEKPATTTKAVLSKTTATNENTSELNSININVNNDKTIVNFVLSRDTYYYVEHGQNQQQLKLILGNTTYTTEPSVNLTHTAVKNLVVHKMNNNTEIDLDLTTGTQIIGLQLYNQPQTQLQLVLLNGNIPVATISKTIVPLTPQQRAAQAYQDALDLIELGKTDKAIDKLYNVIASSSADAQAYNLLATLLSKSNRFSEANKVLITASRTFPDDPRFIQLRAYILAQAGQTSQALQLLIKDPPPAQQNPEYYAFIATLYQQLGQFMLAAQIYNQILKMYPDRAQWWLGLGLSLESANKQHAAKEAYLKAASFGNLPPETQSFLTSKLHK